MATTRRLTLTELARRATLLSRKRFRDGQELNITQVRNALACIMEVQGEYLRQFTMLDPVYRGYVLKYVEQCEAKAAKAKRGK